MLQSERHAGPKRRRRASSLRRASLLTAVRLLPGFYHMRRAPDMRSAAGCISCHLPRKKNRQRVSRRVLVIMQWVDAKSRDGYWGRSDGATELLRCALCHHGGHAPRRISPRTKRRGISCRRPLLRSTNVQKATVSIDYRLNKARICTDQLALCTCSLTSGPWASSSAPWAWP